MAGLIPEAPLMGLLCLIAQPVYGWAFYGNLLTLSLSSMLKNIYPVIVSLAGNPNDKEKKDGQ